MRWSRLGRVVVLMGCVALPRAQGKVVSEDFHGQKINGGKVVECGCHWCNGLAAWPSGRPTTTTPKIKDQMGRSALSALLIGGVQVNIWVEGTEYARMLHRL
jgi:hypothetical protein